ncbi:MAG: type IV secretion system DNA-binding domain-containing protein [Rudaea sp.]|nr:type IV secretion system DNA-binding domain-containing protein [Rudaea sp.]
MQAALTPLLLRHKDVRAWDACLAMDIGRARYDSFDRARMRRSRPIFSISDDERARHLWVIGKTGVGKSTFLLNAIAQDIRSGDGIAVFDPHGDLADGVLQLIPPKRRNDVILFDPSDRDFPIGFNIFDSVPVERRPFVASSVVDCFKAIWGSSWGPQLEMFLYAASAALLDFPGGTLLGIKHIMTSKAYRARVLGHVRDPAIRDFWETDFATHMPEKEQRERTLSTLNKIGQLITDPTVRNIIGQPRSRLSFRDIMDARKILIVRLAQGELGMQKSSLIGALLVSALHTAALQRTTIRTPFHVTLDEFHNFGLGFKEMLSGIRKFGVSLTLCHQYLGQLPDDLAEAMLGTIGATLAFQLGGSDSDRLAKTFNVKSEELSSLEPHTAYLNIGSRTRLLRMEPPPARIYPGSPSRIRRACRAQFAKQREHVERKISAFIKHTSVN